MYKLRKMIGRICDGGRKCLKDRDDLGRRLEWDGRKCIFIHQTNKKKTMKTLPIYKKRKKSTMQLRANIFLNRITFQLLLAITRV